MIEAPSYLLRSTGRSLQGFLALDAPERARVAGESVRDLHAFLDEGRAPGDRQAPERTRELAADLFARLAVGPPPPSEEARGELASRIVTDGLLRVRDAPVDQL